MEIHAAVDAEGAEEFLDELKGEIPADGFHGDGRIVGEVGAAAEIYDGTDERLVHGDVSGSVTADAGFVAEGFGDGLAKRDADVFDGVVEIDFDIALGLE